MFRRPPELSVIHHLPAVQGKQSTSGLPPLEFVRVTRTNLISSAKTSSRIIRSRCPAQLSPKKSQIGRTGT
jgi:hypothetical protein